MDYFELRVDLSPVKPWTEILIAQLALNGYESFVETETGLLAYAPVSEMNRQHPVAHTFLMAPPSEVKANWSGSVLEKHNWNEVWESQFEPVFVGEELTILAPFHDRSVGKGMLIEIMPKMSFGTGHHQTTWMMVKALLDLERVPEKVLDMGTGTGVLAIVAEKLGANKIVAVDIEDWSVENTIENAQRNHCSCIEVVCGDIEHVDKEKFDLILANINKNVLTAHLPAYASRLGSGGLLLLSGFFDSDVEELLQVSALYGFKKKCTFNRDNWAAIKLQLE